MTGEQTTPNGERSEQKLVHIAVPAAYVDHIARLIAELDSKRRPLPPPERRPAPPKHPTTGDWPVEELQRFAQGRSRTHQTIIAVLDLLAERPDQAHLVSDIAMALRVPMDKLVGALGGLTRIVKAYHDYQVYGLPLRRTVGRSPGAETQVSLSMGVEQARRWKVARRLDDA